MSVRPNRRFLRSNWNVIATLTVITLIAVWIVFPNGRNLSGASAKGRSSWWPQTGGPQLISVQPFPEMEGAICEWVPASASGNDTLAASFRPVALLNHALQGAAQSAPDRDPASSEIERAPLRVIRDTYPTYSAIAVDTTSNEVYMQDENLFGLKVFNRLDNTPPNAAFTEPKRVISGPNTKLEFNCGLYIDQKTGDVYSVNNDTMDTLTVFARGASGNATPKRALHTPHGTYGIAVNEAVQELFLTIEHINAVVVYRKLADGEEKPLRTLRGLQTQLEDPHGIAVDAKNKWLFVGNHGNHKLSEAPWTGRFEPPAITVYPLEASGDTAPLRVIEGPKTQLNWPSAMFIDEERQELYVANDVGDSILVFRSTDSGNVAPIRIVKGPQTQIKNPTGVFVDLKNDELWASNMGNHRAVVFSRSANGNVAPLRVIRSAPAEKMALAIGNPGAAAYDSKREEILVPN